MNTLKKEFVPYEEALGLKELGFDEPCLGYYTIYSDSEVKLFTADKGFRNLEAPTFSQAFRFFREEWGLYPHIFSEPNQHFVWCIRWYVDKLQKDIPYESSPTYEEAELACLRKLIEIVKQNK